MNVISALIQDTFREALARKVFWAAFFLSTALLLFFLLVMRVDVVQGMVASVTIFGARGHVNGTVTAEQMVQNAQAGLSAFLYTVGMFLAVFASAGLISAVFEPGRVELLLSKPVSRAQILMGRYLGNFLIIAANLAYLVVGFWLIFGMKTGIWRPHILLATVVTLFVFAVLLAVLLLTGVLWENAAVSILATFALMVLSGVLAFKPLFTRLLSSEVSRDIVKGLYYIFPKIPDNANVMMQIIKNEAVKDWMPVWSTGLFGVAILLLGLRIFERRNF